MIETERLRLRGWCQDDAAAHHAMCSDPDVVRYLGAPPTIGDSRDVVTRQTATLESYGICFLVIEGRADGAFLGWCGIKPGPESTPIADMPEIGWSLTRSAWRQGYAREAASAVIDWFWEHKPDPTIFAITVPDNTASWGLMERLGMQRMIDQDFDHPAVEDNSPLKRHITYRIDRPADRAHNRLFVNHIG
ncbi:MAG: hypothetical protein B7Y43_06005 [Sphingomonas sp. 28-62-20]|uniref:GNAT family N-acetyltransferase n=1 Tax=Sphingomonas sp. 28-62-20 TaxID=1970433 RepID=UPI000BDAB403|nr:MAG: hypothetical protein B7Y43_06005 [Sphingomonas sp. 28-62-20]